MEIAQIVFSSVLLVFVLNLDQPSTHIYLNYVKANQKFRMFFRLTYTELANIGPQDVSKTSPSNVPRTFPKDPIWPSWGRPIWGPGDVLIWRSRDVPGRLIRNAPRTFSGRPLEDSNFEYSNLDVPAHFLLTFLPKLIRLTKSI